MIHRMLFITPNHHLGINVSVRRGDKWFKQAKVGDCLELCDNSGLFMRSAKIIGMCYIPFLFMPKDFLAHEHDPLCHNMSGLMDAMKAVYPDFSAEEMVTVLIFKVQS